MKIMLVAMLAVLLTACVDSNVWMFQIERANTICTAHDGLKFIGDTNIINGKTYLNGKCNSGLEFSQVFDNPTEAAKK